LLRAPKRAAACLYRWNRSGQAGVPGTRSRRPV